MRETNWPVISQPSILNLLDLFDLAFHVEVAFVDVVVLAVEDFFEAFHGFGHRHLLAGTPRENLGHRERLTQEALNLTGAENRNFVVGRKLIHAEDRDEVLQVLVALEDFLDAAGNFIVLLADNLWGQRARSRSQRVHGWVDAQLGNRAVQHNGGKKIEKKKKA